MGVSRCGEGETAIFSTGKEEVMQIMIRSTFHTGTKTLEQMVTLNSADGMDQLKVQKVYFDVCK